MNIATSYQSWKISKAIKEQLPQYPHTHNMDADQLVENIQAGQAGPNSVFLGVGNGSSEWYDPDNQLLVRRTFNQDGPGRRTGYKLEVCLQ